MRPRPFILCFEAHRKDLNVWAVRQGGKWQLGREVRIGVPVEGVYCGPKAPQPRAYMKGVGYVTMKHGVITISPW